MPNQSQKKSSAALELSNICNDALVEAIRIPLVPGRMIAMRTKITYHSYTVKKMSLPTSADFTISS